VEKGEKVCAGTQRVLKREKETGKERQHERKRNLIRIINLEGAKGGEKKDKFQNAAAGGEDICVAKLRELDMSKRKEGIPAVLRRVSLGGVTGGFE